MSSKQQGESLSTDLVSMARAEVDRAGQIGPALTHRLCDEIDRITDELVMTVSLLRDAQNFMEVLGNAAKETEAERDRLLEALEHPAVAFAEARDIARRASRDWTNPGAVCAHPKLQWGENAGPPRKCPDCGAQL